MHDPNFPPNLNISPFYAQPPTSNEAHDDPDIDQESAIQKYGIAGRTWEATTPLLRYFGPTSQDGLDPPCPIFSTSAPRTILELGSGRAASSLFLASNLTPTDRVILTDLDSVIPLCEDRVRAWRMSHENCATLIVRALPWGHSDRSLHLEPLTHILCCDLIYFPQLYPPLLWTLLDLTEPSSVPTPENSDTFGPTVILAYHSRTLALEETFFEALGQYFELRPVVGLTGETKVYLCHRWALHKDWVMPDQNVVMNGSTAVRRGRGYGLIDELFASLEW